MSYVFLYPSFVYFYEYNCITFIFYEIFIPDSLNICYRNFSKFNN